MKEIGMERYWTVEALARKWRVSKSTIYRLIDEGKLRAERIGKRGLRIPESAIEEYRKANKVPP